MRVKEVPSRLLLRNGRRFDTKPYMSGALEARYQLERLACRKDPLQTLTAGGSAGIVNAGRVRRLWVDDPRHGLPFMSSSDILNADLSNLPHIARQVIDAYPQLIIRKGWTLITRSGTIGQMAYARPNMDGMACSEHVMRVIPDPERVPPGYLYAFLSSKYGVPIVVSGTYGSIIQSIEPHHIADLPVPRVDDEIEQEVHRLVQRAAELRTNAAELRQQAVQRITTLLDWKPQPLHTLNGETSSRLVRRRLDAFHHTAAVRLARHTLANGPNAQRLGDVVQAVFEPNRGARRQVTDPDYGIPFLSSSEVFELDPRGGYLISKRLTPNLDRLLVSETDLLLPRSGQVGGIIGRAVLPVPTCYGYSASEHLVRVRCHSTDDAHFLWAVFASEPGYFAAIGTAYGSSIPSLDCQLIADLHVPWSDAGLRGEIAAKVGANVAALAEAILAERKAVSLVEQAIEGAA